MFGRVWSLIGIVTSTVAAGLFLWGLLHGPVSRASFCKWGLGISILCGVFSVWLYRNSEPLTVDNMPNSRGIGKVPFTEFELSVYRINLYGAMGLSAALIITWISMIFLGWIPGNPKPEDMYAIGGSLGDDVRKGQIWRLFTQIFVHGNLGHLGFNIVPLLTTGRLLEFFVGTKKLLIIFFLGGVVGGIVSAWMHPDLITSGATPAIFALFGALVMCHVYLPEFFSNQNTWMVPVIFAGGLIFIATKEPMIDPAAMIGGFVTGVLIVFYWFRIQFEINGKNTLLVKHPPTSAPSEKNEDPNVV